MANQDNTGIKDNLPQKKGIEGNPLGNAFNVMVSIPESLEIKMVNASSLADYEIWIFITTILSSASLGFWVAYFQNSNEATNELLYWNSIILSILFLTTLIVALAKRNKMNKKSKVVNLKATQSQNEEN